MAEVRVTEAHTLGVDGARAKIAEFEQMLAKYGVSPKWKGSSAVLKGMGVSGSIDLSDTAATVVVKLGMMARAAGVDPVKLEASIKKRLKAAFNPEEE